MALKMITIECPDGAILQSCFETLPDTLLLGQKQQVDKRRASFTVTREAPPKVLELLATIPFTDLDITSPSLEDIFVKITGIEAKAMRKEKEKGGKGK